MDCQGPRQLWLAGPGTGVWAELAASLLWPCTEGLYKDQLELDTELVREDDEAASTHEGGLLRLAGPEDWDIKTCPFRKKKKIRKVSLDLESHRGTVFMRAESNRSFPGTGWCSQRQ